MSIQEIYKEIITKNNEQHIFHTGPYNHCENSERIYLDELFINNSDRIVLLRDFIMKNFKRFYNYDFYVCLVTFSDDNLEKFPQEVLLRLKDCNIQLPIENSYSSKYIQDDEWYAHYLFFKESKYHFEKYINSILYDYNEPSIYSDVFIINKELSELVNIYDDRGMDIVQLKK